MNDIFKYAIGAAIGAGGTYLVMSQKNKSQAAKESLIQQIVAKYGNQIDVPLEVLRGRTILELQGILSGAIK